VPIVLKYGSLILLEPSGPVQTCYGIGLPFTMKVVSRHIKTLGVGAWVGFLWTNISSVSGFCEPSNEQPGYVTGGENVDEVCRL
jgi:hypothetical protein